jgi:hypothetical protein
MYSEGEELYSSKLKNQTRKKQDIKGVGLEPTPEKRIRF